MEKKNVFLVIADISGYTKFTQQNKSDIRDTERIICELLESIIDATNEKLVFYEHAGDAVTFYAESDKSGKTANLIFQQVEQMIKAFNNKKYVLLNEADVKEKDLAKELKKLYLKTIVHHGEALFTKVKGIIKVAGQDVIIAHKLLKNSARVKQYILTTKNFSSLDGFISKYKSQKISETYAGLGKVHASIYNTIPGIYKNSNSINRFIIRLKRIVKIKYYKTNKYLWNIIENYANIDRVIWNY